MTWVISICLEPEDMNLNVNTDLRSPGIDEEESDEEEETAHCHDEEGWNPYSSKTVSV